MGKEIRICPLCGNIRKKSVEKFSVGLEWQGSHPSHFKCLGCGFEGVFAVIDESDLKDFRKGLRKK